MITSFFLLPQIYFIFFSQENLVTQFSERNDFNTPSYLEKGGRGRTQILLTNHPRRFGPHWYAPRTLHCNTLESIPPSFFFLQVRKVSPFFLIIIYIFLFRPISQDSYFRNRLLFRFPVLISYPS